MNPFQGCQQYSLVFFVFGDKKLSEHMAKISEHINSSNGFFFKWSNEKIIVNLGIKKVDKLILLSPTNPST